MNRLPVLGIFLIPQGFGLRQPSAAVETNATAQAAESCRSPRRWRAMPDTSPLGNTRQSKRNFHDITLVVLGAGDGAKPIAQSESRL